MLYEFLAWFLGFPILDLILLIFATLAILLPYLLAVILGIVLISFLLFLAGSAAYALPLVGVLALELTHIVYF